MQGVAMNIRPLWGARALARPAQGWVQGVAGRRAGKGLPISRAMASVVPSGAAHYRYYREHSGGGSWGSSARYGVPLLVGSACSAVMVGSSAVAAEAATDADKTVEAVVKEVAAPLEKKSAELMETVITFSKELLASLQAASQRAWETLKRLSLQALDRLRQLVEQGMSSLSTVTGGLATRSIADVASVAGDKAEAAEDKEAPSKPLITPPLPLVPDYVEKYFPVFVFFSIVIGLLAFNMMKSSRDATYAHHAAKKAAEVVRASVGNHPRRATRGGPLQDSDVTAGLVREVLDIVSMQPEVIEALGKDLKEGRLSLSRDPKGGGLSGSFALVGPKGQKATVDCTAKKVSADTLNCTSISVRLPGVAEPLLIDVVK